MDLHNVHCDKIGRVDSHYLQYIPYSLVFLLPVHIQCVDYRYILVDMYSDLDDHVIHIMR